MNNTNHAGNLAYTSELRHTASGRAVTDIVVYTYNGPKQPEDRIRYTLWGDYATKLVPFLQKGKPVAITGKVRTWVEETPDGRRDRMELVAKHIDFLGNGPMREDAPEVNSES